MASRRRARAGGGTGQSASDHWAGRAAGTRTSTFFPYADALSVARYWALFRQAKVLSESIGVPKLSRGPRRPPVIGKKQQQRRRAIVVKLVSRLDHLRE